MEHNASKVILNTCLHHHLHTLNIISYHHFTLQHNFAVNLQNLPISTTNKNLRLFQEETYIECVLENENRETTSPNPAATGERVHRCSNCAYTSTYRGNVIRHARLVHATDEPEEDHSPTLPSLPVTVTPTIDIKKEPKEPESEETPNYCKSCDISFKYVNTFKAHKQFYCTANNQESVGNNNVPAPARVNDTPVL